MCGNHQATYGRLNMMEMGSNASAIEELPRATAEAVCNEQDRSLHQPHVMQRIQMMPYLSLRAQV